MCLHKATSYGRTPDTPFPYIYIYIHTSVYGLPVNAPKNFEQHISSSLNLSCIHIRRLTPETDFNVLISVFIEKMNKIAQLIIIFWCKQQLFFLFFFKKKGTTFIINSPKKWEIGHELVNHIPASCGILGYKSYEYTSEIINM